MAQINHISTAIAPTDPAGVAVAHGLVRAPSIVALFVGCGADVSVGTTDPDATNVYIANDGGGEEDVEVLVMAPHSIIA